MSNIVNHQKTITDKAGRFSSWLWGLRQDLMFSLRALMKHPALAVIPTMSTAVGIGACSLIFAVANFALFRPLPVASGRTLMSITSGNAKSGDVGNSISYPDFLDVRKAQALQNAAAYFPIMPAAISLNGPEPQRYWGTIASANYFDVVRCGLFLGRGFDPQLDDTPGALPVIVLSHRLWISHFGGDPGILGHNIVFNNRDLTVIGVAPPNFLGTDVALASDFWIPFSLRELVTPDLPASSQDTFADRDAQWLFGLARLREGETAESAAADLKVSAGRLAAVYPITNKDRTFHIERAGQVSPAVRSSIVTFFTLLMIISALVLLTACANVANLLLARGYARRQEIATRMALGAGRLRLIRQLVMESVLVAMPGGALGFIVVTVGAHGLSRLHLPVDLPLDLVVSLDWRVLAFCVALTVLTGLVFGLASAINLLRLNLVTGLRGQFLEQGRTRWWNARNILVVAQIGICVLLLTCAGLFFRSLESSRSINTGITYSNIGLISFDPTLQPSAADRSRDADKILQAAQMVSGIQSAALTSSVPLSLTGVSGSVIPTSESATGERVPISVDIYEVSPGFFDTLGISFLTGEDFRRGRSQGDAVVLNSVAANHLFHSQNALGRHIQTGEKQVLRIIGVVATSKSRSVVEQPRPCIYRLLSAGDFHSITGVTLLFRTSGSPAVFLRSVSEAVRKADPGIALFDVRTMVEHLSNALLFHRVTAFLFGVTGLIGLLIATLGLYGVISFLVARQTKEIGIRMALGASRRQILAIVLRRGITLTIAGALIGLCIAFLVGKGVGSFLYGVAPSDPVTFATVPVLVAIFALAACAFPAIRAASVNPLNSIRYQ